MSGTSSDLKSALISSRTGVIRSRKHVQSTRAEPTPTIATYRTSSADLHTSLITLLKHLRQEVTSLSLAFSGNRITLDAAIAQAEKVNVNFDRIVACVIGLPVEGCLIQEWRRGVDDIGECLQNLVQILLEDSEKPRAEEVPVASSSTSKAPPKPYLMATSATWTSIDKMAKSASSTEKEAIKKAWKSDRECLDDAYNEFKDLLEEDEGVGLEEELDGDDEWAELERELAGNTQNMTEIERDRVKNVDTIVRLVLAIHNRFAKFTLDQPDLLNLPENLQTSRSLTSNLDTLVSSLYCPQIVPDVKAGLEGILKDARRLCDMTLASRTEDDPLVNAVENLSIDQEKMTAPDSAKKEKKWMSMWKEQIDKLEANLPPL